MRLKTVMVFSGRLQPGHRRFDSDRALSGFSWGIRSAVASNEARNAGERKRVSVIMTSPY